MSSGETLETSQRGSCVMSTWARGSQGVGVPAGLGFGCWFAAATAEGNLETSETRRLGALWCAVTLCHAESFIIFHLQARLEGLYDKQIKNWAGWRGTRERAGKWRRKPLSQHVVLQRGAQGSQRFLGEWNRLSPVETDRQARYCWEQRGHLTLRKWKASLTLFCPACIFVSS